MAIVGICWGTLRPRDGKPPRLSGMVIACHGMVCAFDEVIGSVWRWGIWGFNPANRVHLTSFNKENPWISQWMWRYRKIFRQSMTKPFLIDFICCSDLFDELLCCICWLSVSFCVCSGDYDIVIGAYSGWKVLEYCLTFNACPNVHQHLFYPSNHLLVNDFMVVETIRTNCICFYQTICIADVTPARQSTRWSRWLCKRASSCH